MKRAVLLAMLVAVLAPSSASAYVHNWGLSTGICNPWPSNTRCTDNAGQTYNPWIQNSFGVSTEQAMYEVCAKAVTAAGNLRSTTTGSDNEDYCAGGGALTTGNTLSSSTPESKAYGYYNVNGDSVLRNGQGRAVTP